MHLLKILLKVALVSLLAVPSAFPQKKGGVHGEVVELVSFVKEGIKPATPAGIEIALENLRKGGMLAVLERKTKKLFLLAPQPNDTAFVRTVSGYFGIRAYVKGAIYKRSGLSIIFVEDIGKSIK